MKRSSMRQLPLVLGLLLTVGCGYNTIQTMDERVNQAQGRLLAIAENYPQLQSSQNFRQLQDQLEGTENRISVARQDYNTAVGEYNAFIRRFPYNLTAKIFGQGSREYFEAAPGSEKAPEVRF